MERERFLPPTPALAGAGGGVPSAALGGRVLRRLRPPGSVLLVLLHCDCRDAVLGPEAFLEEVDDGAVQVLPEGGAVEVMAFVRVDLRGRRTGDRPCSTSRGLHGRPEHHHPRDELLGAPQCTARAFSSRGSAARSAPAKLRGAASPSLQPPLLCDLQHEHLARGPKAPGLRAPRRSGQKPALAL